MEATEDPESRQRRRRARFHLVLLIVALACVVGLATAAVIWRLRSVDNTYKQDLLDTVEVEITALRIGDFAGYMAIQRSASEAFLLEQSRTFDEYQTLKQDHRVELTGKILSTEIDNLRGRVVVEEVIDGTPYKVAWFYWYYEDGGPNKQSGWRHVPDDLTFWGEEAAIVTDPVQINYHTLDQSLAETLAPLLGDWWTRGCDVLRCAVAPPTLTVDIVAERPSTVEWASYDPWTLRVTSPLVGRTRADVAIAPDLKQAIAEQIANRLVRYVTGDVPPLASSDAAWVYSETGRWLQATLLSGDTLAPNGPGLIESLIAQYGSDVPIQMLQALHADSTLDNVLSVVTGVPLPMLSVEQLNTIDWRGFFAWRLALESRLLAQPDSAGAFRSLYDLDNQSSANVAAQRSEDPVYAAQQVPQIGVIAISRDDTGQTFAYVETIRTENGAEVRETVVWRLAGGTWKRVN